MDANEYAKQRVAQLKDQAGDDLFLEYLYEHGNNVETELALAYLHGFSDASRKESKNESPA